MRAAALSVMILGGYLQLVEWVDMFPWNNIRNGNGQEMLDIAMGITTLILATLLWRGWRAAALVSALAIAFWAWLQIQSWWIPYFQGATQGWERHYEHWFGETVSWLPRSDRHLPPDANHLVLHVLIVIALVACVRAAIASRVGGRLADSAGVGDV